MKNLLKFYICDDDNSYIDIIQEKITIYMNKKFRDDKYTVSVFSSGDKLLTEFERQKADVIFLDIDMPKKNGFEIASVIQKQKQDILIIFVTNHEDKVFQSYKYHPFWFVRKSHLTDFDLVLPQLMRTIEVEREKKKLTYNFKAESINLELNINTLIYVTAYRNNIIIKDKFSGDIQIRCKMSSAEKQLYPFNIIRVQNGVLVNCRFISKITSREVVLTNGLRFGLSRSRIEYVRQEYQTFIRSTFI